MTSFARSTGSSACSPTGKVTSFLLRAVLTFPLMRSRLGNVLSSQKSDVARADRASGRCTPAGPRPRRRCKEAARSLEWSSPKTATAGSSSGQRQAVGSWRSSGPASGSHRAGPILAYLSRCISTSACPTPTRPSGNFCRWAPNGHQPSVRPGSGSSPIQWGTRSASSSDIQARAETGQLAADTDGSMTEPATGHFARTSAQPDLVMPPSKSRKRRGDAVVEVNGLQTQTRGRKHCPARPEEAAANASSGDMTTIRGAGGRTGICLMMT